MNNYDDLFKGSTNIDETIGKKIDDLNEIFKGVEKSEKDSSNFDFSNNYASENNSNYGFHGFQKNESSIDPFNSTSEISKVDLEKALNNDLNDINALRKLRSALTDNDKNSEVQKTPTEDPQSTSQAYGGKQKVLSTRPVNKYSDDMSQILQAFISCSILSFITAGMGVGWLLYIIMHI